MSVLVNFAMFPTDKGDSVSEYVSKIIALVKNSNYPWKLNPMGTVFETETLHEAMDLLEKSYQILEPYSERVYATINLDIRKGKSGRLEQKIKSVEDKIGKVNT